MISEGDEIPQAFLEQRANIAFVDASALVALADRDDASHAAAVSAYDDLIAGGFALFTTDLAFIQAHELLTAALGQEVAMTWLERCRIPIYSITADDLRHGRDAVTNDRDAAVTSLAIAVHLAVLDRLGVNDVFAVERSFLEALG
jgi:predicted nucleic acid-binding protein